MLSNNAMSQQEIHLMLIYGNDNDAGTSTQITKVTECLACLPFALTTATHPCLTVFLAVMTAGMSLINVASQNADLSCE